MRCVDLFAGAGGFSTGATMAGASVVWAANHWQAAVDAHSLNHPDTLHACQDLQQADWSLLPAHDCLLASPACQGHSRARGGQERPHHDAARATAWAVVSCAEAHLPRFVVVENVPEFMRWTLFGPWCDALRALGYRLSMNHADAADHGVPQFRKRVFIVGTRAKQSLWLESPKVEHVAARTILGEHGKWREIADLCAKTRERVKNGRARYGESFLVAYYGAEKGGRSLDRPLGTVTTVDRYGLVRGDRLRMLTVQEYRAAMGFPADYLLPDNKRTATKLLGNAVCPPVARDIVRKIMEAA